MPRSLRAPALLLAALAGCERPALTLPAGRHGGLAIDDHTAVILAAGLHEEQAVVALVDERGAPRWTHARPIAEFAGLYGPPAITLVDDLVLVGGAGLHAFDRATGERRWYVAGASETRPLGAVVRAGRLLHPGHERLDALDPATGAPVWTVDGPLLSRVVALTGEYAARISDLGRHVRERPAPPGHAPREHLELVRGPTGEVMWSAEVAGHCQIADHLVAAAPDGSLLAVDLTGLLPLPQHYPLVECGQRDGAWWLRQEGLYGASLIHAIDPRTGVRARQVGLCSLLSPVDHRHVLIRKGDRIKSFDLDADAIGWEQDQRIHPPYYGIPLPQGDLMFVASDHDDRSGHGERELQNILAMDPATAEITGAVTLRNAEPFKPAAGVHWLFGDGYHRGGPAIVLQLGHRDLRPLGPLPPDLGAVDITAEVRASLRPADVPLHFSVGWYAADITSPDDDPDGPCIHHWPPRPADLSPAQPAADGP
jgi:hypothetical protein